MSTLTHPRLPPRRGTGRTTWWSKALLRAVEEAAYSPRDLRTGRALARAGAVGAITVSPGTAVAAVTEGDDAHSVTVTVPELDADSGQMLVEVVASGVGHIAALMSGDLPHAFVEALEESGVELLPYGGELGATCSCQAWLDPCPHALAVMTQVAWLVQGDPFVLLHLRGLSREEVLARLHVRQEAAVEPAADEEDPDLDTAVEAALRAARLLGDVAD
ncbi:MAG: SWIM zinc finger family protein [Nocardioides sp.]|nr:SWIM zinc finger family protein [Nocardioides sp.]